jgi:uncharacterized Zn finger protein
MNCQQCGANNSGEYVQWGSSFFRCHDCGTDSPATTFLAYAAQLKGIYSAFEVDLSNSRMIIAHGAIDEMVNIIDQKAVQGKLICLVKDVEHL